MPDKKEEGSSESRSRYVWDRDKLSWVETVEEPTVEEVPIETAAEEDSTELAEELDLVEAVEEAEVLEYLEYKGALARVVAIIIDFLLLLVVTGIAGLIIGTEGFAAEVTTYAVMFVFFAGFWSWRGQTPGKMLMGAKIVKRDGRPVGIGSSLLRSAIFVVYYYVIYHTAYNLFYPAILILVVFATVALSRKKRGIHDLIAGTCVIDSRAGVLVDYAAEEEFDEGAQEPDASK